jgi:hypothetical protein
MPKSVVFRKSDFQFRCEPGEIRIMEDDGAVFAEAFQNRPVEMRAGFRKKFLFRPIRDRERRELSGLADFPDFFDFVVKKRHREFRSRDPYEHGVAFAAVGSGIFRMFGEAVPEGKEFFYERPFVQLVANAYRKSAFPGFVGGIPAFLEYRIGCGKFARSGRDEFPKGTFVGHGRYRRAT